MKRILTYLLGVLLLILIGALLWPARPKEKQKSPLPDYKSAEFLMEYIGMKKMSSDPLYSNAYNFVFNDTLVGLSKIDYKYFIQPIENPTARFFIEAELYSKFSPVSRNSTRLRIPPAYTRIVNYKNGNLYFRDYGIWILGRDGRGYMYLDTRLSEHKSIVMPRSHIFFENKMIIVGFNGVFVFDEESRELLWDFRFTPASLRASNATLVGKYLIFCDRTNPPGVEVKYGGLNHTILICLNLETLEVEWKRTFEIRLAGLWGHFDEEGSFINNGHDIIAISVSGTTNVFFLDVSSSATILNENFVVRSIGDKVAFGYTCDSRYFQSRGRVDYLNTCKIVSHDLSSNSRLWEINGQFLFKYNEYIIAHREDVFMVINKLDGRLEQIIPIDGERPRISQFNREGYWLIGDTFYK